MQEWKGVIKYKFAKIKELPIESIKEDSIVMPKFDGETSFLFFDHQLEKWVTCNNWGHYRTDYRVTQDAEKSTLDKDTIYVGELIYGKNLYDFLRHKKDGEGLRLVLFEIYQENPSIRERKNFEQRLKSIPLSEIYLEDKLNNPNLHLGRVPYFYHLKSDHVLEKMFEGLTETYEGIVIRGLNSEWVMKVKKKRTLDVVVMGMQKKGKSWDKGELGSFLVGLYHEGKLLTCGTVGFPRPKERKALFKVIMDNMTSEDKYYVYVSPKIVMEIIAYDFIETKEYETKKTFRSPIFQRWRPDKPSTDCLLEHQFPEALE